MADAKNTIDGKRVAQELESETQKFVDQLRKRCGHTPGLAVVLVGEDPASQIYVKKKNETCRRLGMESFEHRLPASTSERELRALVQNLNADPKVDGILIQLPLPAGINSEAILELVDPTKDVDGFHPHNVGLLNLGRPRFVPCTPLGMMKLLQAYQVDPAGMHAVVVGRSNIVGKPIAQLLLAAHATVTIAHSKTKNLAELLKQADLVVAAVGRAEMIRGEWLKPGCVVLDVGINRLENGKLVGDVHFPSALAVARLITPVPGGVGPMTIACLMRNTLQAAQARLDH